MNQADLITAIAASCGLPKVAVGDVLNSLCVVATAALARGDEVPLPGLGKLAPEGVAARTGRNPATGEAIQIPAKTVAKFKAAKALKETLNP